MPSPGRVSRLLGMLLTASLLLAACPGATRILPETASTRAAITETARVQPVAAPPRWVQAPAEEALRMLVVTERAASIQGDEALLIQLWAEDARIRDGRATATRADDYLWTGRQAILDRYRLAVFPSPPPSLDDPTLSQADITVAETADGTREATVRRQMDEWRMVERQGRWWLQSLTYNAPAP